MEDSIIIRLLTQMGHLFPDFPMEMTRITVRAVQIAAMTPHEGVVQVDYHRYHHQALVYSVVVFKDAVLVESTK